MSGDIERRYPDEVEVAREEGSIRSKGYSSVPDLRLRVGQGDEDFDLFGIAKGGIWY